MIPSVLSSQIQRGIEDFLKTTFPVSTPFFHGVMDRFLKEDDGIFKGLENEAVIVVDLESPVLGEKPLTMHYAAMSRARAVLSLIYRNHA